MYMHILQIKLIIDDGKPINAELFQTSLHELSLFAMAKHIIKKMYSRITPAGSTILSFLQICALIWLLERNGLMKQHCRDGSS